MTCGVCGDPVRVQTHQFYEGTPERPSRQWSISAPLYFKATADGLDCDVPFCGPRCAVAYLLSRAPTEDNPQ